MPEIDNTEDEKEYDGHKLAKMLLIAVASFAVGKIIETTYDSIRDRRDQDYTPE